MKFMVEGKPFVITIVGAESSGKTTLGLDLAAETGSLFLPEFAREYLASLGREYDLKDLEIIAERQWEILENAVNREPSAVSPVVRRESSVVNQIVNREPTAVNQIVNREPSTVSRNVTQEFSMVSQYIKSKIVNRKSLIIVDSGMMNLRMWARIKYGMVISVVEEALRNDVTDLYLLCRPRTEW